MSRAFSKIRLTPLRIALIYLVLGLSALYFSDILLVRYFSDPLLSRLQALKGGVEVLVTAGFIFVLARGREAQLQRGIEDLDLQRLELQVLHRVLRHNLRNDINVMQGYAELLKGRFEGEEEERWCDTILETAAKMTRYTNQANRIRKITEHDGRTETFDLTEVIPRVVERNPLITDEVRVSTSVPDQMTVRANRMLEAALSELLANAIEHNDKDTPELSISVGSPSDAPHMVEIRVADNGPGIPALEREPLLAEEEDELYHLSGLGLWFVKWTARHSGGEFRIEETEPEGTTAILRVPKTDEQVFPKWFPVAGQS